MATEEGAECCQHCAVYSSVHKSRSSRSTLCQRAGQPGGSGDVADTPEAVFAALPAPIVERILYTAFVAGERRMAARARLCCVCTCAASPGGPVTAAL